MKEEFPGVWNGYMITTMGMQ
ncbi:hypothetical protein A2U01_0047145, partial [Trifolium medium]|nr:hypothetical protein [Trifolium medium]